MKKCFTSRQANLTAMAGDNWQQIAKARYVSLTSFRKDGSPRPTPVWIAPDGESLYFITVSDSYKVKRIQRNPEVTLQPCDVRGKVDPDAPVVEAWARILEHDQTRRVRNILARKYKWQARLSQLSAEAFRPRGWSRGVEISPTPFGD